MDVMLSSCKSQFCDSMTCTPVWYGCGNMGFISLILFHCNNKKEKKKGNQNETKEPMECDKDDCIMCLVNAD